MTRISLTWLWLSCLVVFVSCSRQSPEVEVLVDDGGAYTVSASEVLVGEGINTQALNSPRVVLEIRNYNSTTWGQRSRAALKITWYSEQPLTGTAMVGLQEAPAGDTIVRWSQQPVSIILEPGRSSRTVTYYSSYTYKPDARMCAETAFYLQSGELGDEESLYIDYGQKTCELVAQNIPQDDVMAAETFTTDENDTLMLELTQNAAGEYRGILTSRSSGNWLITDEGNFMGIREADSSSYKRSNPFTLGFEGEGVAETVTRYAPDLAAPVCFDVRVNVRGTVEDLSVCEEDDAPELDDNATVILEHLAVEQEGQGLFVYKIHQHNVHTDYFKASLETVFSGFELSPKPDFTVTGYADGNTSTAAVVSFEPGLVETPWIKSNEPGEEVCYLLQATWNAYDLEDWGGQLSGSFRHSDCVQMDDVTSPPTRATTKAAVTNLNQGNVGLNPYAGGAGVGVLFSPTEDTATVIISPVYDSQDTTGIYESGNVRGEFVDSAITLGTSTLDLPANNGGTFTINGDGTCVNVTLVYGDYDEWDHYFETVAFKLEVC